MNIIKKRKCLECGKLSEKELCSVKCEKKWRKMLDKKRFFEILSITAELYDKTLSEGVLRLYYNILKDYNIIAVEKALNSWN